MKTPIINEIIPSTPSDSASLNNDETAMSDLSDSNHISICVRPNNEEGILTTTQNDIFNNKAKKNKSINSHNERGENELDEGGSVDKISPHLNNPTLRPPNNRPTLDVNLLNPNCANYNSSTNNISLSPNLDNSTDSNNSRLIKKRNSFMIISKKVMDVSKDLGHTVKNVTGKSIKNEFSRFLHRTSAHGLPMIVNSSNWYTQTLWSCLTIASIGILIFQCKLVYMKYKQNEKLVNVNLQFDSLVFPSITVCNLNGYKHHLAKTVPELQETLQAFKQAVSFSKEASNNYQTLNRNKRDSGFHFIQYEPIISECTCKQPLISNNNSSELEKSTECIQKDGIPEDEASTCICNFDTQDGLAWPCFIKSSWRFAKSPECNDIGYCNLPSTSNTSTQEIPCMCQKDVGYCLLKPQKLRKIWEIKGTAVPKANSPYRQDFLEQLKELGYENTTDEVAITTKAKEKLILTMASLPTQRRIALGYGKNEFIQMCSWNGNQCNINEDFRLHTDPQYGNCYTFNSDSAKRLISSRAGSSYGLRLMLYVNSSDYLPTTEMAGVKISIHEIGKNPYPEIFGYSGPTGAISSYGISLRKVKRLGKHGECVMQDEPLPENYIYKHYDTEGCVRSYYQASIIQTCKCADPRYPTSNNSIKICDIFNKAQKNCLLLQSLKFEKNNITSTCKPVCGQNLWTTSYSAAKWPSGSFKIGSCENSTIEECTEHYSKHAAMVEIYYEQMSYEQLEEVEAYSIVNLISDTGGQVGLWIGGSVLTFCEIIFFSFRLLTIYCRKKYFKPKKDPSKVREEQNSKRSPKIKHNNYSSNNAFNRSNCSTSLSSDEETYNSTRNQFSINTNGAKKRRPSLNEDLNQQNIRDKNYACKDMPWSANFELKV